MAVRRAVHALGFRFRLHRKDLAGTPDLVFPRLQKVIFVHGRFWHQHDCRLGTKQPRTNPDYWLPKLARNVERDRRVRAQLADEGWQCLVVWECETRSPLSLNAMLADFLG